MMSLSGRFITRDKFECRQASEHVVDKLKQQHQVEGSEVPTEQLVAERKATQAELKLIGCTNAFMPFVQQERLNLPQLGQWDNDCQRIVSEQQPDGTIIHKRTAAGREFIAELSKRWGDIRGTEAGVRIMQEARANAARKCGKRSELKRIDDALTASVVVSEKTLTCELGFGNANNMATLGGPGIRLLVACSCKLCLQFGF